MIHGRPILAALTKTQSIANLLRLLSHFPHHQSPTINPQQTTVSPPNKLTPPATPSPSNIGRANMTAANASALRTKLFSAKMLAA